MTLIGRALNATRGFSTSALRRGAGVQAPGENLPFNIENKYALTLKFILFFGSGLTLPFLVVRHQLLKK